jgi:hypothetical protein
LPTTGPPRYFYRRFINRANRCDSNQWRVNWWVEMKNAPKRSVFARYLAGQNIPHHKPPKSPKGKPIKHLGSSSSF